METQRVALTLPSEARAHITRTPQIKWGDLDLDLNGEIAEASGAGVDINPNYKAASLASFRADQCALEKAPSTAILRRFAELRIRPISINEGRSYQTPGPIQGAPVAFSVAFSVASRSLDEEGRALFCSWSW